jgi:mxaJ protein
VALRRPARSDLCLHKPRAAERHAVLGWEIPDAQIWEIAAFVRSLSVPAPLNQGQTTPPPSADRRAAAAQIRSSVEMNLPAILMATILLSAAASHSRELRVCADPNNLPFSNHQGDGFENKIVDLIAHDLDATAVYTWWAQRRGFVRNTLRAQECDLWPGIVRGSRWSPLPGPTTARPMCLWGDRHLDISSFDDPRLRALTIGVQMVGNDAVSTPPVHALARRRIVESVRGYMLYGDYSRPNPPAAIVDAVAQGEIDIAVVLGPLAGYFAAREPVAMNVAPVSPAGTGRRRQ